ncbi:MAG: hypothetical protein JSS43_13270 [Proteobacteria bacterium]|nr:hypothetical protein [Pseudomonadota bacterium]
MPDYSVFLLNEEGRIYRSMQLEAGDDTAALKQAQNMIADSQVAEVWLLGRMVGTVPVRT